MFVKVVSRIPIYFKRIFGQVGAARIIPNVIIIIPKIITRAWTLKMELFRVNRPLVADLHHFDEEQDPDPDFIEVKSQIRIRIKAKRGMRIWNPISSVAEPRSQD
jgi:hypothetical protein